MEARVPVATGQLRQSIGVRVSGQSVIIGPDTPYAAFVEFGTKPHVIEAKNKKALMFVSGGQTVIVKKVHHPGTKAQPFVQPAFDAWVDTLGGLVAAAHIQQLKDGYRP
jgi:HK97 gp10 family phage protein